MSITRHIPNAITCLNLACGVMACLSAAVNLEPMWGMQGWQWAVAFMGMAAVADFCDGLAARLLHAYSAMGKELDSLADAVSFGVAPGLLVYYTMLAAESGPYWPAYLTLLLPVAGVLRLARFNVDDSQATTFTGLPIPSNALFWIGAVAWVHAHGYPGWPVMVGLVAILAWLMVCPLRMFSLKVHTLALRDNVRRYALALGTVIFVASEGLAGLAWTVVLYVVLSLVKRKAV